MTTIHFLNVGRNKATWDVQMREVSEDAIIKAVRKKGCLMSRDIDVELSDDFSMGNVYAGCRCVGTFTVERATALRPAPAP